MPRVLEQEVMTDPASVQGYAAMTVNPPNLVDSFLIPRFQPNNSVFKMADLGCGPCGYHKELYQRYPNATIDAYEASVPMLVEAANYIEPQKTALINSFLPDSNLPQATYDVVLSSMFLHQLPDPMVNWNTIKQVGKPGAKFIVFDLLRVEDETACWNIVNGFTPNGTAAFKQDFVNTLRASFIESEIIDQLNQAGLSAIIDKQEVYPGCIVVYIEGTL